MLLALGALAVNAARRGLSGSAQGNSTPSGWPAPASAPLCRMRENWSIGDPNDSWATVLRHNASENTAAGCCAACEALPACKMGALAPPSWGAYAGCYLKTGVGNGTFVANVTTIFAARAAPANGSTTTSSSSSSSDDGSAGANNFTQACASIKTDWSVGIKNDVYAAVIKFEPLITTISGCCAACAALDACVLAALAPSWWEQNAGCYLKTGQGTGYVRGGVTTIFMAGRKASPYLAPPKLLRQTVGFTVGLTLLGWALSLCTAVAVSRIMRSHDLGQLGGTSRAGGGGSIRGMDSVGGVARRGSVQGVEMSEIAGKVQECTVVKGDELPTPALTIAGAASEVTAMMAVYSQRRAAEKQRKQRAVANVGLGIMALCMLIFLVESIMDQIVMSGVSGGERARVSSFEKEFFRWDLVVRPVMTVLGGCCLCSSGVAPEQLLSRPVLTFFFVCTTSGWFITANIANAYCFQLYWSDEPLARVTLAYVPEIVLGLFYLAAARRVHSSGSFWGLRATDIFVMYLVIWNVNNFVFNLRIALTGMGPISTNQLISASFFLPAVPLQLFWLRKFGRKVQSVWYLWMFNNIASALFHAYDYEFPCSGTKFRARSYRIMAILHLSEVTLWIGAWWFRKGYFRLVSQIFERKQRIQDGAVVASLLELRSQPAVDDAWWLIDRAAKHWHLGRVAELRDSSFRVVLNEGAPPAQTVEQEKWLLMPPVRTEVQLMEHAVRTTRSMPFGALTLELLRSSSGDASTFALSEPLKPGNHIDWFISHSWHDDCEEKYDELVRLAAVFKRKHKRMPTVWLDKTCIDQSSITDSLKCLPIFLQSCDEVVALVGTTYFSRLWCVWELYARIVFTAGKKGGKRRNDPRVHFSPLSSIGGQAELGLAINSFSLSTSHCFDPNEKYRLTSAIAAADGGCAAFETAVRSFGSLMQSGSESSRPLASSPSSANSSQRSMDPRDGDSHSPGEAVKPLGQQHVHNPLIPQQGDRIDTE